jgi:hypothetical protein
MARPRREIDVFFDAAPWDGADYAIPSRQLNSRNVAD